MLLHLMKRNISNVELTVAPGYSHIKCCLKICDFKQSVNVSKYKLNRFCIIGSNFFVTVKGSVTLSRVPISRFGCI